VVTAHQPTYLPWLGLFHKIALSDAFVLFDDVRYDDRDFINRNRIRGPRGPLWLTVPILEAPDLRIADARIRSDLPWRRKHHQAIVHAYGAAPHAARYLPFFDQLYARDWQRLAELDRVCLEFFLAELDLEVELMELSAMHLTSAKSELVLDVCRHTRADLFLFGASGRDYADREAFRRAGVAVEFQDYQHPEYDQGPRPFLSHLSVVDLLFHCGPDSLEVLMSGNLSRAEMVGKRGGERRP
jgi:hypothetical protein